METPGLILSRGIAYLALLLVAGLPILALSNGLPGELSSRQRRALALLALVAAGASIWWALESVAAMAGLTLATLDQETFTVVLVATPLGAVMEWRLTALFAVLLAMVVPLRALRVPVATLAGGVALGSMAWTGHAGASEVPLHRWADVVHLVAAATWIGALAAFVTRAFTRETRAQVEALAKFARTGTVIVALLLLTGMVNTLAIAGWPVPLSSRWTMLLALKLGLFAAMLGLAASNRWRIVPALERGEVGAVGRLRRSMVMELAAGLGVVAIVSLLGVLDPAA